MESLNSMKFLYQKPKNYLSKAQTKLTNPNSIMNMLNTLEDLKIDYSKTGICRMISREYLHQTV